MNPELRGTGLLRALPKPGLAAIEATAYIGDDPSKDAGKKPKGSH